MNSKKLSFIVLGFRLSFTFGLVVFFVCSSLLENQVIRSLLTNDLVVAGIVFFNTTPVREKQPNKNIVNAC